MGLVDFAESVMVQPAVYWSPPVADGYGGYNFANIEELKVRWEGKNEIITTADGRQVTSTMEVLVPKKLTLGGYLWFGELATLTSVERSDPKSIVDARPILQIMQFPPLINHRPV